MAPSRPRLEAEFIEFDDIEPHLLDDLLDDGSDFFSGTSEEDMCSFDQHWRQEVDANIVSPVNFSCNSGHTTISSPTYPSSPTDPREVHRKQAIARWLRKRERRTFLKRKVIKSSASEKKIIPKRSSKNGRFVKCTTSFVSITDLQNSSD